MIIKFTKQLASPRPKCKRCRRMIQPLEFGNDILAHNDEKIPLDHNVKQHNRVGEGLNGEKNVGNLSIGPTTAF